MFVFGKNEVNNWVKCGGMWGEGKGVAEQGLSWFFCSKIPIQASP